MGCGWRRDLRKTVNIFPQIDYIRIRKWIKATCNKNIIMLKFKKKLKNLNEKIVIKYVLENPKFC
jgi:hypothetical protein